jgi:K+-sensing histidine kinase KdpD
MMAKVRSAPTGRVDSRRATAALAELRAQHDELLRSVSHDLRTPLVGIALQAHVLERTLDARDPNRQRASAIIALTTEFTAAIDRLVTTARLEAGLARCHSERIALPDLVRDLMDRVFPAQSGRVRLTVEAGLPDVVCDRHHLETLVRLLLERAMSASTAEVGLEMSRSDGELLLAVDDQGPAEAQAAESPHPERSRVVDGLHLARLIVDFHGGRLWSGSPNGRGNTTTVALPLDRARRSAGGSGR